jgi:CheY-like chemotaxis protein
MLADDDPDDRDLLAEAIIAGNSAHVESAHNGAHLMLALTAMEELPDMIFLDLNMPEKNGKECLSEIRQHDRLKGVPVIIYSTSSSKKDIDDAFDLGATLYVTKPNSFSELKPCFPRQRKTLFLNPFRTVLEY